jgi:serine/threonine-protein kinase
LPGICAAIIADEPPSLRSTCHDAPAELEAVVGRCLEKNAVHRFQSIRDLMLALRPFASTAMQSGVASSPGSQTMPETGLSGRGSLLPPLSASATLASVPPSVPAPSKGARQVPSGAPVATSHRGDTVSSSSAPPSWLRRPWLIAAAALVAACLLVLLVLSARQPRADNTPTPVAPTTAAAPERRTSFALTIESVPAGAEVLEGDRVLGTTPLAMSIDNDVVRKGPRQFSLKREQFESYAVVQGPSQDNVRVLAQLRPIPTADPVTSSRTLAGAASVGRASRHGPDVTVSASASAPSLAPTASARPLVDDIRPRR